MRTIKEGDIQQDERGRYIISKSGRKIHERACRHCGEPYFYARIDQKHCSGSCRVLACRLRKKSTKEILDPDPPSEEFSLGKLGRVTGTELGDVVLGNVVGNVATGLGKKFFGLQSEELKAIERLEKKLDSKPGGPPAVPVKKTFHFTGFSLAVRCGDDTVTALTELILDGQRLYLDNMGMLYKRHPGGFQLFHKQGRKLLGL